MNTVTLNNGVTMPLIGFGVFQVEDTQTQRVVEAAIAAGYRLIDTAASYGNEKAVGAAIAASGVPRDELFVTTKLWIQDHPAETNTARAFDRSLHALGLDYVDLYVIHQPYGDYYGEWRGLQQINRDGSARAIGVSNFAPGQLVDLILNNDIVPALNQIETHPFKQNRDYQQLVRSEGVQIESWGPFAEGRNSLFTNEVLTTIGNAHNRSVAQVVLRWMVQRQIVVIPKTVNPDRMAQNLAIFDFVLTDNEMDRITELETGQSQFFDHADPEAVRRLNARRLG